MTAPEANPVDVYPIGSALTVALGALGDTDDAPGPYCGLGDLYAILGRILGDVPAVDDLPDAIGRARTALLVQYPDLGDVDPPADTSDTAILTWLAAQEAKFGATLRIQPAAAP